jgi:hypothetical protein
MILWVTTLYAASKVRSGKGRGKEGAGLYPELDALRFCKGSSPALSSEVARLSALHTSFEVARKELERCGSKLDIKSVHRTTLRVGAQILTARKRDLKQFLAGKLPKGNALAGKRIGIAVDGARTRMRESIVRQIGSGQKKKRKRSWKATWREPKKFIIFELDDQGRMRRGTNSFIEGTILGPDELMQLLAMRLHQLGAVDAEQIVFLSDGGTWIWNRIEAMIKMSKINRQKFTFVLDVYHAIHHIQLAVEALGFKGDSRKRVFQRLRRKLYKGQPNKIVEELRTYLKDRPESLSSVVKREMAYFVKHEARMQYHRFRAEGKPIGSGAIERAIRRVINLRLKGNGIMWRAENAEAVMVIRAAVLSGRWEETLEHTRALLATNRTIDWIWSAPDMRNEKIPDQEDHGKTTLSLRGKGVNRRIA